MSDRFKMFTTRARRAMTQAQAAALRLNHDYIGPEHFLLGLLDDEDSLAVVVLGNLQADRLKLGAAIEARLEPSQANPVDILPLTASAKKVIELAVDEAKGLGHAYIGPEHLLLGLLREADNLAAEVLNGFEITLTLARAEIIRIMSQTIPSKGGSRLSEAEIRAKLGGSSSGGTDVNFGQSVNFESFTERARKVLTLAFQEAIDFRHNYIGPEHLLIGLVREGDGVAARVLKNLGVELEKVRDNVAFIVGRGERMPTGNISLQSRSEKVLKLAEDEVRILKHHYIGTEHLLLGLINEGENIAVGVLESLGVDAERVRQQVIEVLNQSTTTVQVTTGNFDPQDSPDELVLRLAAAIRNSTVSLNNRIVAYERKLAELEQERQHLQGMNRVFRQGYEEARGNQAKVVEMLGQLKAALSETTDLASAQALTAQIEAIQKFIQDLG